MYLNINQKLFIVVLRSLSLHRADRIVAVKQDFFFISHFNKTETAKSLYKEYRTSQGYKLKNVSLPSRVLAVTLVLCYILGGERIFNVDFLYNFKRL